MKENYSVRYRHFGRGARLRTSVISGTCSFAAEKTEDKYEHTLATAQHQHRNSAAINFIDLPIFLVESALGWLGGS